jgi:hypothetical protein
MEPYAHREIEARGSVPDAEGAADRSRRAVERCQEAVAGGLYLSTAESVELPADHAVVGVEEIAPSPIAVFADSLARLDDVAEHHRGEHAIGLPLSPGPLLTRFRRARGD